jgi:hypothetical protein
MEPGIVAGEAVGAGTCRPLAAKTRADTWPILLDKVNHLKF